MVLFATYRNARLVPKNFMKPWVDWHRSIGEYWNNRPWAHGAFLMPGFSGMTTFLFWLVPWYVLQRWGPSLEDVRKNLSPEDQARARGFYFFERVHGNFLPAKWKYAPAGGDFATASHAAH